MDVFGFSITAAGDALRAAAIAAGPELGVFDGRAWTLDALADANGIAKGRRRMRPLLDLLVALGGLRRDGEHVIAATVPPRPEVARTGWGAMVDVFRGDKALSVEGGEVERRYHQHLTEVGAPAAAELAPLLAGESLIDLGCGAGTYTAAYLDRFAEARALAVDFWDVVPLAKQVLARIGERAQVLGDEISTVQGSDAYAVALLANVLHLHAPVFCAKYVARAARLVAPGGRLVIKELRVDEDRGGPLASLMFALNMAIYTGGGDVYPTSQLRAWLEEVHFTAIEEHRLASSPDSIVIVAYKPRGATRIFETVTGLVAEAVLPPTAPAGLRTFAGHAVVAAPELLEAIQMHYALEMPRQRAAQLALQPNDPGNALLHHPLGWSRLPRMRTAIERLFGVLHEAGVTTGVLGFATPRALFGEAPSLARLYERTYYGGTMPLLNGYPADLAYFAARGDELGLDRDGVIDRYLTAPVLHELCHFAPDRDALPPHLDECMAGWLAVHAWPEFAYPAPGWDDAIYAAPWLSQVGQAFARAFGIRSIVRAQAGAIAWDAALPPALVEELSRRAWLDWTHRRSLHFLADPLDPDPWVTLALARPLPDDAPFDRQITADALRAMCLDNQRISGSFRTRTRALEAAIHVDAVAARIATAPRNELDAVAPRYGLPPAVAAAIRARGHAGYELFLGSVEAIPAAVETLCTGAAPENFTLVPRELGDTRG
ncbi:MAG: methyltransferase [Kofleriaceae bacterium]